MQENVFSYFLYQNFEVLILNLQLIKMLYLLFGRRLKLFHGYDAIFVHVMIFELKAHLLF
jgi:hypothetical protein